MSFDVGDRVIVRTGTWAGSCGTVTRVISPGRREVLIDGQPGSSVFRASSLVWSSA